MENYALYIQQETIEVGVQKLYSTFLRLYFKTITHLISLNGT